MTDDPTPLPGHDAQAADILARAAGLEEAMIKAGHTGDGPLTAEEIRQLGVNVRLLIDIDKKDAQFVDVTVAPATPPDPEDVVDRSAAFSDELARPAATVVPKDYTRRTVVDLLLVVAIVLLCIDIAFGIVSTHQSTDNQRSMLTNQCRLIESERLTETLIGAINRADRTSDPVPVPVLPPPAAC